MASSQPEHPDRAQRESVFLHTEIERPGHPAFTCRVRNISATGMMIECANDLQVGDTVTASLRGVGKVECSVARVRSGLAGLHFATSIDPALCRKSVLPKPRDPSKDWVLNLREPYKGKRWE